MKTRDSMLKIDVFAQFATITRAITNKLPYKKIRHYFSLLQNQFVVCFNGISHCYAHFLLNEHLLGECHGSNRC